MPTRTGEQSRSSVVDNPVPGIPNHNAPLDPEGGRVVDPDANPAESVSAPAEDKPKPAAKKAPAKAAAKKATAKKATARKRPSERIR